MTILLQRGGQSPKKEAYTSTGRGARIGLRGQILVDTKNREYTVSTLPLIYYPNYMHRPCLYKFGTIREQQRVSVHGPGKGRVSYGYTWQPMITGDHRNQEMTEIREIIIENEKYR